MNWEAIAAVGEVSGAVAVVASVLYLGLQVREANRESRAASVHALQDSLNQWLTTANSREVATLWLQGLEDYAALDPVDRVRFNAVIQVLFRIAEDGRAQIELGRLPIEIWEAFEATLAAVLGSPGVQVWWKTRERFFTPLFREWVDAQIAKDSAPLDYRVSAGD